MRLSASQIGSFERCPMQYKFEKVDKRSGDTLSATIFGTVIHHAIHAFEREMASGTSYQQALHDALATFEKYWHPYYRGELTGETPETTVEWMRGHTQGGLLHRGFETIKKYADIWRYDEFTLLSLEHPFEVPLGDTGHTISGFVDRLGLRKYKSKLVLDTDDWKTGKRKFHLRHHLGLTVYAYASTQREFWEPFGVDADELFSRFADLPRHCVWYDLQGFAKVDAGYRGPMDYHRLIVAGSEMARSVQANIFPLRINGEICDYCPHKRYCPDEGSGLPEAAHGAPAGTTTRDRSA